MRKRWLLMLMLLASTLFSITTALAQPEVWQTYTLDQDGVERRYHVFVPDSVSDDAPAPLVVALHPYAASGKAMAAITGLDDLAQEYGFVLLTPDSDGLFWRDGRVAAGLPPQAPERDDLAFLRAAIDETAQVAPVDSERVFVTGTDSGGRMAYRMACEYPEALAGVAVVNTMMWSYHTEDCPPEAAASVPVLMIQGDSDPLYPIGGLVSEANNTLTALSIRDTLAFWILRNECDINAFDRFELAASDTVIYTDCADDSTTAAVILRGVGHQWPRNGQATNQFEVDASEMVVRFFLGEDWRPADIDAPTQLLRSYRLYVPSSYQPDTPLPLVVVLHGRPDNSLGIATITEFNEYAEQYGFAVLYPDGINERGWAVLTDRFDDLAFFDDLLDDVGGMVNIDSDRTYLTGFSNGGFMTQRVACEAPDLFDGYAVVGATLFEEYETRCADVEPTPMLFMHGTLDVNVPWSGDMVQTSGGGLSIFYSVQQTVLFWAETNGCTTEADVEEVPRGEEDAQTRVLVNRFRDCAPDAPLTLYVIENGGHNWPGVPGVISDDLAGLVNTDIHASDEIWQFFSALADGA